MGGKVLFGGRKRLLDNALHDKLLTIDNTHSKG